MKGMYITIRKTRRKRSLKLKVCDSSLHLTKGNHTVIGVGLDKFNKVGRKSVFTNKLSKVNKIQ